MKIFLLLILSAPVFAVNVNKTKVFDDYQALGAKILGTDDVDPEDVKLFNEKKAYLEDHEYQEGKVEQLHDKVSAHVRAVEDLKYKPSRYAFVDYTSWQQDMTLKTPGGNRTLIVTNQAWCPGAGFGKKNSRFHFGGEGCFLYGRGDVGSQSSGISYTQSNVYGKGMKVMPFAGLNVSSVGAELGLKLPLIWFDQKFSDPKTAGYDTRQPSPFRAFLDIYGRWPLGPWFLQSDIGRNLGKDLTIWSVGIGRNF